MGRGWSAAIRTERAIPLMSEIDFRSDADIARGAAFLKTGFLVEPVADAQSLERLRDHLVSAAASQLGMEPPADPEVFLDQIHHHVSVSSLNDFRLALITALNAAPWVRRAYFDLARPALESLVGNELCMQRRINLSIQMPEDDSSLLSLHADTWSGDSPFEVVVWIPFTSCYRTKSMFLLPPLPADAFRHQLSKYETQGTEAAFLAIEDDVKFIDIDYGHFLLFNQNLPHGNRVNRESETRWSTNCRFKGVFTPYADKKLGEFFEPITLRPASRIGLAYEAPSGFEN